MIPEIGNEMRGCKLFGELSLRRLQPLPVDKVKEIKSNADSIDANQIGYVFNVIDVTIESDFFFFCTHQDRVNANHTAPFPNHLDLVIVDVALDIVVAPDICMRNNWRLCRH